MTVTAVRVEEARSASPELVAALERLVPQLSSSAPPPSAEDVERIASASATRLLVARDDGGTIVGSLTLVVFRIPTKVGAHIEDVVVDEAVRGRGVGEALIREATRVATEAGARAIDLTSRPSREAANRLYRRLGFEERDTNVYRWTSGSA